MGTQIYKRKEFIIFRSYNGYIAQNTNKDFKEGHTHLNNYNACKKAINYVITKKIPKRVSFYYLESLIRLSKDKKYQKKIRELIEVKKSKSNKKYININKGVIK